MGMVKLTPENETAMPLGTAVSVGAGGSGVSVGSLTLSGGDVSVGTGNELLGRLQASDAAKSRQRAAKIVKVRFIVQFSMIVLNGY